MPKQVAFWASKTGYLPVSYKALKEPVFQSDLRVFPGMRDVINSLKNAEFEPRSAEWLICRNYLSEALEEAIIKNAQLKDEDDKKTPQEILDEAVKRSNRWLIVKEVEKK